MPPAFILTHFILSPGTKKAPRLPDGYKGPYYMYFVDHLTRHPAIYGEPIKVKMASLTGTLLYGLITYAEVGLEWAGALNNAVLLTPFGSLDVAAVATAGLETTKFALQQFKSVATGLTQEDVKAGSAAFREFVCEADPKNVFGGLKRYALVDGPVVWCLEASMKAYRELLVTELKNRYPIRDNNNDDDDNNNDNNNNDDDDDDDDDDNVNP
ncbi:hypothetical protein SPRG_18028 [Saprolegnia parasitica CBS 223.65]|uniref:Uncharacterized protein n=1 Tax=Saprolegnia parasitica (strain CBS 223.65) TaxID=695850 RepID=A0A067BQ44_SAPPC|nr:hypothetical protein SPRG_18028 [Saprolegnia parasitica CBS 223.65]KDO16446.1 hypothetical protein SPRG_18028 [Saprolegnia parasitica CBS 223.65]|eukprot:XP_012212846.1 hypothetical protein SPRG_18028 [Saprolegnia parasitica CBS 223.65]